MSGQKDITSSRITSYAALITAIGGFILILYQIGCLKQRDIQIKNETPDIEIPQSLENKNSLPNEILKVKPGKKKNSDTTISQEKEMKNNRYVYLTLIVDSEYSKGDILVNGIKAFPVKNTLTIKELEIPLDDGANSIEIKVIGVEDHCLNTISIPDDYFNKPYKIKVACTK